MTKPTLKQLQEIGNTDDLIFCQAYIIALEEELNKVNVDLKDIIEERDWYCAELAKASPMKVADQKRSIENLRKQLYQAEYLKTKFLNTMDGLYAENRRLTNELQRIYCRDG